MLISDVTGLSNYTLACDVYDATTHTTTTINLGDISSILEDIIARKYNHRYFYYTGSQPTTTPTSALKICWENYKIMKQDSIDRVFDAMVYKHYDPTENVFEYNHTKTEHGDIDVTTNNGKVESVYGSVTSESTQGKKNGDSLGAVSSTSTGYETTYDGGANNEKLKGHTTNESDPVTTKANTSTHTDSVEQTDDATQHTERENDNVTIERHGNVGTVASADMILKELAMRKTSFYEWLCADFINEYTYYNNVEE